jgi:hypothetical protein
MEWKIYPLNGLAIAAYMNWNTFIDMKEIENRVDELYGECFDEDGIPYFGNNSVLIMYVNMKNEENKKRLLSLNREDALKSINLSAKNILGFLRIELYKEHAEIYDVCTGYDFRKQGIMHDLFQNMFLNIKKKYFWLGVTFDNPNRDTAIRFYLKEGFSFKNVGFVTPSNIRLKFPVLSFIKGERYPQRNMFLALSDIACNFTFKMKWTDMIYIQNNVYNRQVETGGSMDIVNGFLVPDVTSIVFGSPSTLSVATPVHYINWHSHPDICYKKFSCYIGWPSGQDMKNVFHNYSFGMIFHLIFTAEGLYTIKLTESAMKMVYILSFNHDWLLAIEEIIVTRFTYVEKYRGLSPGPSLFVSFAKRDENIKEFLRKANTATLRDYLNGNNNVKVEQSIQYLSQFTSSLFPIFEVAFYPSDRIYSRSFETIRLNTIRAPTNNFCPL